MSDSRLQYYYALKGIPTEDNSLDAQEALASGAEAPAHSLLASQNEELREELRNLQTAKCTLEEQLEDLKRGVAELDAKIKDKDAAATDLEDMIESINDAMTGLIAEKDELAAQSTAHLTAYEEAVARAEAAEERAETAEEEAAGVAEVAEGLRADLRRRDEQLLLATKERDALKRDAYAAKDASERAAQADAKRTAEIASLKGQLESAVAERQRAQQERDDSTAAAETLRVQVMKANDALLASEELLERQRASLGLPPTPRRSRVPPSAVAAAAAVASSAAVTILWHLLRKK